MNKTDLINQLADRLDGDKKAAQTAVEGFIDLVQREVQRGRNVSISGFGVFEKRARAARTARNPRTGEAVKVKKTTVPAFRPGKYFKDVISGSVKLPKATAKPTSARAAAAAAKSTAPAAAAAKTTQGTARDGRGQARAPHRAPGPPPRRPRRDHHAYPRGCRETSSREGSDHAGHQGDHGQGRHHGQGAGHPPDDRQGCREVSGLFTGFALHTRPVPRIAGRRQGVADVPGTAFSARCSAGTGPNGDPPARDASLIDRRIRPPAPDTGRPARAGGPRNTGTSRRPWAC